MKQKTFVIIKSYKRFLASEHSRGLRKGCLGEKCFVHGCDSNGPLYPFEHWMQAWICVEKICRKKAEEYK